MSEHAFNPMSCRVEEKTPSNDRGAELRGSELPRTEFRKLMETIRARYATNMKQGWREDAAFQALAEERNGGYQPDRFPLRHVVNALVRVSPTAKRMNTKYFGGRYS